MPRALTRSGEEETRQRDGGLTTKTLRAPSFELIFLVTLVSLCLCGEPSCHWDRGRRGFEKCYSGLRSQCQVSGPVQRPPRTMSGPEGSSIKRTRTGAAGHPEPDQSGTERGP